MTESDRRALARLVGGDATPRASTDDLQSLLLQVSLALLMIFMIACFIFRQESNREREQAVMAVNRQKLSLALDKVSEDYRIRYGLNALMTQGVDGSRSFDAAAFVRNGALDLPPAVRAAFAQGGTAAAADFADVPALSERWRAGVFEAAGVDDTGLSDEDRVWFSRAVGEAIESVRLDARGVQRALAANLQRGWIEHPENLPGAAGLGATADFAALAGEVEELLKTESLKTVAGVIGGEVLP